mgnify:CR=1 FL=1
MWLRCGSNTRSLAPSCLAAPAPSLQAVANSVCVRRELMRVFPDLTSPDFTAHDLAVSSCRAVRGMWVGGGVAHMLS